MTCPWNFYGITVFVIHMLAKKTFPSTEKRGAWTVGILWARNVGLWHRY